MLNTNDGDVISNVPLGINVWEVTSIVNGGDTPLRVTSVKAPSGQYTVAGLPKPGTVIKPGQAIPVQGEFTPTQIGAVNSSFTITTNKGQSLVVTLTGTGLKPITRFASVPAQVNFGSVRVGPHREDLGRHHQQGQPVSAHVWRVHPGRAVPRAVPASPRACR